MQPQVKQQPCSTAVRGKMAKEKEERRLCAMHNQLNRNEEYFVCVRKRAKMSKKRELNRMGMYDLLFEVLSLPRVINPKI